MQPLNVLCVLERRTHITHNPQLNNSFTKRRNMTVFWELIDSLRAHGSLPFSLCPPPHTPLPPSLPFAPPPPPSLALACACTLACKRKRKRASVSTQTRGVSGSECVTECRMCNNQLTRMCVRIRLSPPSLPRSPHPVPHPLSPTRLHTRTPSRTPFTCVLCVLGKV